MDNAEAYKIAQGELLKVENGGYQEAYSKLGSSLQKNVVGAAGIPYDVELSYCWSDREQGSIKVACSVTSSNWYQHQQLAESIVLCKHQI